VKTILAVTGALAIATMLAACGGSDDVAKVNGAKIDRGEVESLIELYKSRAEAREGEAQETGKDEISHAQEVGALQVLVQREILEQKAKELGIHVDEDAVERRADVLRGREPPKAEEQKKEKEESEKELDDQLRATARAALIYEALYRNITTTVRVPRSNVLTYYRSHLSSYSQPGKRPPRMPPPNVEQAITRGLSTIKRNETFQRWLRRLHHQFAPEIEYRKGWAPQAVP
jgi:SurA-like N-terminal domain